MSASKPASREELKEFCLRRLGKPVIEINVADEQVEDLVDTALQFYQEFHYDAFERVYLSHEITTDDINNEYITIASNVVGVVRVFATEQVTGGSDTGGGIFNLNYQVALNDFHNLDGPASSLIHYTMTRQNLALFDMLFNGEKPLDFVRHKNRIKIARDWSVLSAGTFFLIEAYQTVDPEAYPDVYDDRFLKNYLTLLIKRQWGSNISKFANMSLPGGVQFDGVRIYQEADTDIKELEGKILSEYEVPPEGFIG